MMEDSLSISLLGIGYRRIDSNVKGIYLFYRVEENELNIISAIHAAGGNELTIEQYTNILEQIKANFRASYPHRLHLLSLIFTGNPNLAKHLCAEAKEDSHWIIDISTNRLMIYEMQSKDFTEIQKLIDELLSREQYQGTGEQAPYGSNGGAQGRTPYGNDGRLQGQTPYENDSGMQGQTACQNDSGMQEQAPYGSYAGWQGRAPQERYGGMRGWGKVPGRRAPSRVQFTAANTTIIIINIFVFLFTQYIPVFGGREAMLEKGALSWYFIKEHGEFYRILTSMFLHSGWDHLINNMIVLLFVGSNLERAAGKVKYLFIYFGSGIIAGICSISYNMWKEQAQIIYGNTTISIGASGAIFGVVGAILFIVVINRGRLAEISTGQMILFVVLSLYSGIINAQIDQAAHIGGFFAGISLAVILYRRPNRQKET